MTHDETCGSSDKRRAQAVDLLGAEAHGPNISLGAAVATLQVLEGLVYRLGRAEYPLVALPTLQAGDLFTGQGIVDDAVPEVTGRKGVVLGDCLVGHPSDGQEQGGDESRPVLAPPRSGI